MAKGEDTDMKIVKGHSRKISISPTYIAYVMGILWFHQDICVSGEVIATFKAEKVDSLETQVEKFHGRLMEMLAELEL